VRFAFDPRDEPRLACSSLLQQLVDGLLAAFFPSDCSLCGEELDGLTGAGICRKCWEGFQPWRGPLCFRCGLFFPSEHALDSVAALCAECRRQEYAFDFARSFDLYSGNLRAAILQLKFHRRERLGLKLGELLCLLWSSIAGPAVEDPLIIVPVPLHRARLRQRGYNQAELVAQGLARALARRAEGARMLRVEARCLRRLRPTVSQTGLDSHARQDNVRGAFAVAFPERIGKRNVLLVDDVMTTGATVSACSQALKRAGAKGVVVLALARATPQFPDIESVRLTIPDANGDNTF
jgi:ComF family protein